MQTINYPEKLKVIKQPITGVFCKFQFMKIFMGSSKIRKRARDKKGESERRVEGRKKENKSISEASELNLPRLGKPKCQLIRDHFVNKGKNEQGKE